MFCWKKNVSSFCKSYSYFFTKNISIYAIFNDQNFNDTLTNGIVSFEQLGPDFFYIYKNSNNTNEPDTMLLEIEWLKELW